MPIYRPSEVKYIIILAKPIDTVTTLEVRGSEDGFATDRRDFSTEEEIRVNGAVTAADRSSITGGQVEIYLDGALHGRAPLSYDSVARTNLYVYSLGMIATEGSHEVRVVFPRYRTFSASSAQAIIGVPLAVSPIVYILIGAGVTAGIALLWLILKK